MDGDGDFDAEDVQLYLDSRNLGKAKANLKKPRTAGQDSIQPPDPTMSVFDPEMHMGRLETPGGHASMEKHMLKHQHFPFFIMLQTFLASGLWLFASLKMAINENGEFITNRAGIDTFVPGVLDLRIVSDGCEDLRFQLWRTITYQFTHVGLSHIMTNCFLNLILGIPLEGLHGSRRIMLMYNVGVFGGACCYWVGDARRSVVGMSGGCYALIGIHVASLLMNWRQTKFRIAITVFLLGLVSIDCAIYVLSLGSDKSSHTAHVGGIVAGLIIGVLAGKNMKVEFHEYVVQALAIATGALLMIFAIIWLIVQDPPKHLQEDYGWCWLRQVYSPQRFGNKWQCVQCATKACIENFQDIAPNFMLMVTLSKCPDVLFEGSLYPR
jgi:rhomboid protease GluP